MLTKYSYDNVNAMVKSIHSNSELINSMVQKTMENDKEIKEKMTSYAANKSLFSQDQMVLYKDYIEIKECLEGAMDTYSNEVKNIGGLNLLNCETSKDNQAIKNIHDIFDKINTLQIKIMEMLCEIIGRSNVLLSVI